MGVLKQLFQCSSGRGIIGDLAISANGVHVLALHGGFRSSNWRPLYGATFVDARGARPSPVHGRPAFVLDDGRAGLLHDDLPALRFHIVDGEQVDTTVIFADGGYTVLGCVRSDADHVVVSTETRDDGHGWSEPVYGEWSQCFDLRTGKSTQGTSGVVRFRRGPGSAFVTSNQAPGYAEPTLPFRAEWPVVLGHSHFVTDRRVFAVPSNAVLFEAPAEIDTLEDLSIDEARLLAVTKDGVLEVWDVGERRCIARGGRDIACARFVGPTSAEIVAGTNGGDVLRFALEI